VIPARKRHRPIGASALRIILRSPKISRRCQGGNAGIASSGVPHCGLRSVYSATLGCENPPEHGHPSAWGLVFARQKLALSCRISGRLADLGVQRKRGCHAGQPRR
jgi:hypothetical protein